MISIYESCRHRSNSADDAAQLTQTVIDKATLLASTGVLRQEQLVDLVISALENFDPTSAAVYRSFHPRKS